MNWNITVIIRNEVTDYEMYIWTWCIISLCADRWYSIVFTIFDEMLIHIMLVCPGILLACWLGLVIIDATFWMTCFLKKSDVILVREVLSCLPCPILHLIYPYRLAPFSTIAMHTNNNHLKLRPNRAVMKKTPQSIGHRIRAIQKICASYWLIRFFLASNTQCDSPLSST